jgi:O-6-methylguanine DNA methyltransferase
MFLKNVSKKEYFLKTGWGILKIDIDSNRVKRVLFAVCPQERIHKDAHFHDTFADWLVGFQYLSPDDRWAALSPEGTGFQKQVWRALLEIPSGAKVSYGTIAAQIGRPKACRAVGSAVGANPIALLIPCHRVVPASGGTGNYRWGSDRKQALLEIENACNADFTQLFKAV